MFLVYCDRQTVGKKFPNSPYAVCISPILDAVSRGIYALNLLRESLGGLTSQWSFFPKTLNTERSNRQPHYFDYTSTAVCVEKRRGDRADVSFCFAFCNHFYFRQTHRRINSLDIRGTRSIESLIKISGDKWMVGQTEKGEDSLSLSQNFIWNISKDSSSFQLTLPGVTSRETSIRLSIFQRCSRENQFALQLFRSASSAGKKVHRRLIMNAIKNPPNLNKLTLGHCRMGNCEIRVVSLTLFLRAQVRKVRWTFTKK